MEENNRIKEVNKIRDLSNLMINKDIRNQPDDKICKDEESKYKTVYKEW